MAHVKVKLLVIRSTMKCFTIKCVASGCNISCLTKFPLNQLKDTIIVNLSCSTHCITRDLYFMVLVVL